MGPRFGEFNTGALLGAMVGAIGGLFAVGLAGCIIERSPALLFQVPFLTLLSWLICGLVGWFLGGQLGPRLGMAFRSQRIETLGGILAGLLPVIIVALCSWYLYLHYSSSPIQP